MDRGRTVKETICVGDSYGKSETNGDMLQTLHAADDRLEGAFQKEASNGVVDTHILGVKLKFHIVCMLVIRLE